MRITPKHLAIILSCAICIVVIQVLWSLFLSAGWEWIGFDAFILIIILLIMGTASDVIDEWLRIK